MTAISKNTVMCLAWLLAASLGVVVLEQSRAAAQGQVPVQAVRSDVGTVRGTLIYNAPGEAKASPDGGSDVWVFAGKIQLPPECTVFASTHEITIGECAARTLSIPFMKHTQADAGGRFEIRDLSIGDYTLVARSAHAVGKDQRDAGRKFATSWFTIKGGDTVEISPKF